MISRMIQLIQMLLERRVGFMMDEVMSGTHRFVGGDGPPGEHPMQFNVTWGSKHMTQYFNPLNPGFMSSFLEGTVTVGGLVENAPCMGKLDLLYFTEGKLRYTFDFKDDRGRAYHYVGEKVDLRPWNLHVTHTTCYGTITNKETGEQISKSILHFRFHTIPAFMMSFRLG